MGFEDLYGSLEKEVIDELKDKYNLQLERIHDVLQLNRFKERFMSDFEQFDFFEPEDIAHEFYQTYRDKESVDQLPDSLRIVDIKEEEVKL